MDDNVFRRDRDLVGTSKKDGGAVLIAIKISIIATRRCEWESDGIEEIFLNITLSKQNLLVNGVYIPPKLNLRVYEQYFDRLEDLRTRHRAHFCLVGDFNVPDIEWLRDTSTGVLTPSDNVICLCGKLVIDAVNNLGLK